MAREQMKMCLRQWVRPKGPNIKVEGVGDCKTCVPHEDNKYCRCFYEITAPKEFEIDEN